MPEVFIIGAQRSGSTYLYKMLDSHPQVQLAKPCQPEPKFFLDENSCARGRDYYEKKYHAGRTRAHRYIGEKSTSYIESKYALGQINRFYPNARILCILRNPVERAYSNYRFSVAHGLETLTFAEALAAENERLLQAEFGTSVNPFAYQTRGRYFEYLVHNLGIFSRNNIKIMIYEEFIAGIESLTELYRWLDIDDGFVPADYGALVNESGPDTTMDAAELGLIKQKLTEEFLPANKQLEAYLGRKIEAWRLE